MRRHWSSTLARGAVAVAPFALSSVAALGFAACRVGLPDDADKAASTSSAPSSSSTSTPLPSLVDGGTTPTGDAGDGSVAAPACPPQAVGAISAEWHPPTSLHQTHCSSAQARAIAECIFSLTPPANCSDVLYGMFDTSLVACRNCALSTKLAPNYGPIIDDGNGYYTNPPGCVAALDGNTTTLGCGAKTETHFECMYQACKQCSNADYPPCTAAAERSVCATYAAAAACNATTIGQCTAATPLDESYKLIMLFCGP